MVQAHIRCGPCLRALRIMAEMDGERSDGGCIRGDLERCVSPC